MSGGNKFNDIPDSQIIKFGETEDLGFIIFKS